MTVSLSVGTGPMARWRRSLHPQVALAVVAGVYLIATLVTARRLPSLLYDEVVYASRLANGAQPVAWSAPRAWGMPLLLAPVDMFTRSVPVIRTYLAVLAGAGLFLAFRPWFRVIEPWVVPVAAGLFATLWLSVIYGPMAYPNLWLALAAIAGTGYVVRGLWHDTDRWTVAGILAAFAVASMLRPTDATYLALPLGITALVRRAWRPVLALTLGLGVGWAVWIGEAYLRFGGLVERLQESARVNDMHLGFHADRVLQSIDGPYLLCRPASLCTDVHGVDVLWLLVLPVLVGVGVVVTRPRAPYVLATIGAGCLILSYVLTIDWFSARFLLPAYGLLALPVAAAIVRAARWRRWMALVVVLVLVAHVGVQARTYQRLVRPPAAETRTRLTRAETLHDGMGLRAPCAVFGDGAVQLSFLTGCAAGSDTPPSLDDAQVLAAREAGSQVAVIVQSPTGRPPAVDGWRIGTLAGGGGWYAYVSVPGS